MPLGLIFIYNAVKFKGMLSPNNINTKSALRIKG